MDDLNEFIFLKPDEVTKTGKYLGLYCSNWFHVKVKRTKYAGRDAFLDFHLSSGSVCSSMFSVLIPVKKYGIKLPKFNKDFLISKGVSEFWLS